MPSVDPEKIRKQIEAFRRKLLDLTLRNRMLNYRPSKRLSIEVKRELSREVLRILVDEGRKMTFIGVPDPPKGAGVQDELYDAVDDVAMANFRQAAEEELTSYLGNPDLPVSQGDTKLTTDEYVSILQVKLRTIHRESALAREELGINTLFLTLGALEWRETEERSFIAPLVFVPVTLEKNQNGTIKIVHDGSDPGLNLPLSHKLGEFNVVMPEWDDEKPLPVFFDELTSTVASRSNWVVHRDAIHLGFFNYEKYAMYVDLGGDLWPEGRKPWQDEDLAAIFGDGYRFQEDELEGRHLDAIRPPAECHEVYDCDSSQTTALLRAASGLSMVIEGPPGTGKSQTITNIIAEAVAAGKTVLFVSAKRAAVEVVKRRLTVAGLGDMCLDLHDKLTNRKQFYTEIKRTANVSISLRQEQERVARLTELRNLLNEHSAAVNDVLEPFGISPFQAMSELARLPVETPEDRAGRMPFDQIRAWHKIGMGKVKASLSALQQHVGQIGVPSEHPFWGCGLRGIDPSIRLDLQEGWKEASAELEVAIEQVRRAAETLHVPTPKSAADVAQLRACVALAESAPSLEGVSVTAKGWKQREQAFWSVFHDLTRIQEIRSWRDSQVRAEAWTANIREAHDALVDHSGKWYRFLIGPFRKAKATMRPLLTAPLADRALRDLAVDLEEAREKTERIQEAEEEMRTRFGVQWEGIASDPARLKRILTWMIELEGDIESGEVPAGFIAFLTGRGDLTDAKRETEKAEGAVGEALASYRRVAGILKYPAEQAAEESLQLLADRVAAWQGAENRLTAYVNFVEARAGALDAGLSPAVDVADRWELASSRLVDSAMRSYYLGIVREATDQRPALRRFERVNHERMIADFRDLDDFMLQYNRARVRIAHHARIPRFDSALGSLKTLKVQCELQRSHKPIRWSMARAGEAIQAIKPVFMMSPLSVAIHLPPEMPPFDMVIFDEASQVKPEDALSAIARAKQTIVVGDTRQMPPTTFFDRVGEGEEFEEELDDETSGAMETTKLESILSLMSAAVNGRARRPDLQWHYRSIHPALIQPSNEMFYDNRLIVFPSADTDLEGSRVGTVFHHHPETVYEPGSQKRFNRREAEIVADAVMAQVRNEPHLSLMVAAMNKAQADLIYQEVEKRKRANPDVFAKYSPANPSETLEIKNLETVQGDERDVVMISITYGRDASGVIRQNFGPILNSGGERRLNVLISRARRRCEVFTNITADDIRAEGGRIGLETLKRYLAFAEHGDTEVSMPTGLAEESPFEEEVHDALRAHGYEVDTQMGCGGFRIDLAVRDPHRPGRYLLGVECDGATYHSARSARDRDKLRETVLADRGWRLHRIWSHDWWQDKAGEIERLLRAIEEDRTPEAPAPQEESVGEFVMDAPPIVASTTVAVAPYQVTSGPVEPNLADYLVRVVQTEGPIHRDLLHLRLRKAQEFARLTQNMRAQYDQMIGDQLRTGRIALVHDALVATPAQSSAIRDWSEVPDRALDYLTEVELANAILAVVRVSFGISSEEAVKAAFAKLGFKRLGDEGARKGRTVLDFLILAGSVKEEFGTLKAS